MLRKYELDDVNMSFIATCVGISTLFEIFKMELLILLNTQVALSYIFSLQNYLIMNRNSRYCFLSYGIKSK